MIPRAAVYLSAMSGHEAEAVVVGSSVGTRQQEDRIDQRRKSGRRPSHCKAVKDKLEDRPVMRERVGLGIINQRNRFVFLVLSR